MLVGTLKGGPSIVTIRMGVKIKVEGCVCMLSRFLFTYNRHVACVETHRGCMWGLRGSLGFEGFG